MDNNMKKETTLFEKFISREKRDLKSFDLWRATLAEYLGVLILTFLAVGAGLYPSKDLNATPPSSVHIALEAGFYIAVIISTLTTVSGGHVNPAISIGFLLRGDISVVRFVLYVIAQNLGAISGAGLLKLLTPAVLQEGNFGVIEPAPNVTEGQAVACEFVITFLLLFGTFALIDEGRKDVQGSIPLIIGLIVVVNILAAWNISGGCMNPARNFGPAVVTGKFKYTWVYWVGPMFGAASGALLYERFFSTKVCRGRLHGCTCTGSSPDANIEDCDEHAKHEEMQTMTNNSDMHIKI